MRGLLARAILICSLIPTACGRPDTEAATDPAGQRGSSPVPPSAADADRRARVPRTTTLRIFQDLTSFDWYRQGDPLVHDGRSYQPSGPPVRAQPETMRKIGEYGGVDIYVPEGSPEDSSIYVPVYEGYWLAFIASDGESGPAP